MVAASGYSRARARKPERRGWFGHVLEQEAVGGQRVHVPTSGRWMNGMNTPFSTSSIVSSSTR